MYFLTLLQCWKDEQSPHEYGGALRPDSKILLFMYYRVKHVFSKAGLQDFHLYQVKNGTNWSAFMQEKYSTEQIRAMWKQHQEARDDLKAFKEWMYTRYEAEAAREYVELVASQGEFDTLANRRVDETRRPGSYEQFQKESAAGQRRRGLDTERQCWHQSESEARRNYSRKRAEEIQAREGGLPSPMVHSASSPMTAASGTPVKEKKKLTWDEFKE